MPRHDGSHGVHHTTRQKGGNTSRRTRTPKNTYGRQRTPSPFDLGAVDLEVGVPVHVDMGRHSGSSTGKSSPQKPKPTVKGGSKPVGGKGK
jgi:hypothetical protein